MSRTLLQFHSNFRFLGMIAYAAVLTEITLLLIVVINSIILSSLLIRTYKHLSTATILFIFNILLSNVLFVSSLLFLFSEMFYNDIIAHSINEVSKDYVKFENFIKYGLNLCLYGANGPVVCCFKRV